MTATKKQVFILGMSIVLTGMLLGWLVGWAFNAPWRGQQVGSVIAIILFAVTLYTTREARA